MNFRNVERAHELVGLLAKFEQAIEMASRYGGKLSVFIPAASPITDGYNVIVDFPSDRASAAMREAADAVRTELTLLGVETA